MEADLYNAIQIIVEIGFVASASLLVLVFLMWVAGF